MFFKISVLKNFAIFTGKRLCCSLFLIKLQAFWPKPLLKRDSYFIKHLRRLLLSIFYFRFKILYTLSMFYNINRVFFFVFKKNSEFSDSQFLWWVIKRLRVFKQVKENGCCYRQISLDQDILKAW